MTKVMDCVIYNHASLLDMIEKESAEFEPWYTAGSIAESHSKNYGFIAGNDVISSVKSTTSSLFDDLNRLESLNGSVFSSGLHAMETDWLDREECMNWDPQLLVNPRTGAPVDSSDSDLTFNSKLVLKKDIDNALNILTRPASGDDKGSKLAEVTPVKGDITIPSRQLQTFTTFTIADPNISNPNVPLALQSQLIASSTNTMPVQVILQVTNAVGSIVPTDGTLCLIKMEDEEQTVKLPVSAANSQIPAVSVQAEEEGDEAAGECSENFEKPVFSYSCLIAMALKNSESGSLPVNEIYAYILEKFPYFRTAPDGWKNSIRHNLSLNKCFEKIENPTVNGGSRKGCLWGLNPAKADKMDDEIAKWIKRAAKANNNNGKEIVGNQLLHAGVALNDGESHIVAPSSTPTYVTVCSQPQSLSSLSGPAITVSSSSGELDILEDSIESSDPMLAGIAVQNGLWDDLTETDELMSTAFSFGNGQLTKASKSSAINNRIRTSSATCRSSHAKVTSSLSSDRPHTSSTPVAIIANQAAIG